MRRESLKVDELRAVRRSQGICSHGFCHQSIKIAAVQTGSKTIGSKIHVQKETTGHRVVHDGVTNSRIVQGGLIQRTLHVEELTVGTCVVVRVGRTVVVIFAQLLKALVPCGIGGDDSHIHAVFILDLSAGIVNEFVGRIVNRIQIDHVTVIVETTFHTHTRTEGLHLCFVQFLVESTEERGVSLNVVVDVVGKGRLALQTVDGSVRGRQRCELRGQLHAVEFSGGSVVSTEFAVHHADVLLICGGFEVETSDVVLGELHA